MAPREVPSVVLPRQDYFRPVAAASTAHVVTEAIRHDTPSGRLVISTVSVAGCALTGYYIGGKEGALVGALMGLLLAYLQQRDVSPSPVIGQASSPSVDRLGRVEVYRPVWTAPAELIEPAIQIYPPARGRT